MRFMLILLCVCLFNTTLNVRAHPAAKASPQLLPRYCPNPLVIVFYGDWYPYMFFKDDQFQGVDHEFFVAVLNRLGCQVKVDALPEKRAHSNLAKGGGNLVMSGATVTKERKTYAYFSKTYRDEVISLFYLSKEALPDTLTSVKYLVANSQVIATNGAAFYGTDIEELRNSKFGSRFIHMPSLHNRVEMLHKGRAQAIIEDYIAGCNDFHLSAPDIISELQAVTVNKVRVAFMFSKAAVTPEFVNLFDENMQQLIDQGMLAQMMAKYTPMGC
ncbi:MAG: transporter substrate-binding domain-containing protein [Algicola sp.]|nr:transporter substrate-binding domain-containing protein [Algicola sp.]